MELREFVKLDAGQVRRDKELMQLFVNFYEAAFSFIPKCAGCSFKSGFKKLRKYAETGEKNIIFDKTTITMESKKTFLLKKQYQLKILTYKKDGITHRKYGHALTEEFARELVIAGKSDLFITLPSAAKAIWDTSIEPRSNYNNIIDNELNKNPIKIIVENTEDPEKGDKLSKETENDLDKITLVDVAKTSVYESMNHREELLPLYSEVKERTGKKALSNRKSDIIAFLLENES